MSQIIKYGQSTPPSSYLPPQTKAQSKMTVDQIANTLFFGPGLVTHFVNSILKIQKFINKLLEENVVNISIEPTSTDAILLHEPSRSSSPSAFYYSSEKEGSSRVDNQCLNDKEIEIVEVDGMQFEVSQSQMDPSDSGIESRFTETT